MTIQWKKYGFTLNEMYGAEKDISTIPKADLHAYFQQQELIHPKRPFTLHKQVLTLCIDLEKSEEALRKDMNRTTRYQLNKGARDNLTVEHLEKPTNKDITDFEAFFNPFAEEKEIELCRTDKLKSLCEQDKLIISNVYHPKGQKMASHLYIATGVRAIMLYSCSGRFANADIPGLEIGRANRYLHWQDMLYFKEMDYVYYDFLGLSINPDDKAQQNVNQFKKGFGGFEIIEYQSFIPQNLRGALLIIALKFLWRKQYEVIQNHNKPAHTYLRNLEKQKTNS